MYYKKKCCLIILPLLLASCSMHGIVQNRGADYLKAESIPPLKIPPGLSSSTIHEAYPVSNREYSKTAEDVSLVPPGL